MEFDYNTDSAKAKKELTKRKDRKDKDKGYAALGGDSSGDESPCKAKKSKAFKFSKSKVKDKAEPGSSKYKIKKKAKPQKAPKGKLVCTIHHDLAEELPIFGCSLEDACRRGKCHDGIPIPLPVRECIDFVEDIGKTFENVYKTSGNKQKVQMIKKSYDDRQPVNLYEYDVQTVTSVFKLFFRELSDPLLTNELSAKFEEAASMIHCRNKVLLFQSLVSSLPLENRTVLGWLIVHFWNIAETEQTNKMTVQNLAQALHQSLRMSLKVLCTLIRFRCNLFEDVEIIEYHPPLKSGMPYPEDPAGIAAELAKLESALDLIHWEMQQNYSSKNRQDQLWELQRIQTELKRKQKKAAKGTTDEDAQMPQTQDTPETQETSETQETPETHETHENQETQEIPELPSGSEAQTSMGAEVERLLTGSGGLPPMHHSNRPTDVRRLFSEEMYEDGEEDLLMHEGSGSEEREASENEMGAAGGCEEREASENESEDADEQELDDKESDEELQCDFNKSIASTVPSEDAQSCSPKESKFGDNFCAVTCTDHYNANVHVKRTKLVQDVLLSGKALLNDKLDRLNLAQIEQVTDDTSMFLESYTGVEMLLEQFKNQLLKEFKNKLMLTIDEANLENLQIESQCQNQCWYVYAKAKKSADHFEKVLNLLQKENHMLLVNKIELIRKIMENREDCLRMEATLKVIEILEKKD